MFNQEACGPGSLCLPAFDADRDKLRFGENEFADFNPDRANRISRQKLAGEILCESLKKVSRMSPRDRPGGFTNLRVINGVLNRIVERVKRADRPQLQGDLHALCARALRLPNPELQLKFEILNEDTIAHGACSTDPKPHLTDHARAKPGLQLF